MEPLHAVMWRGMLVHSCGRTGMQHAQLGVSSVLCVGVGGAGDQFYDLHFLVQRIGSSPYSF